MLTLAADGRIDVEVDAWRTMLTLIADGLSDAEMAAGFARLTKARGIAAVTLDNSSY